MTEQASLLTTFCNGWENYQQSMAKTIASLSPEQLTIAIASHWSIGEILAHMIDARIFWFYGWMGEGDADLVQWYERRIKDELSVYEAAELVVMFEKTWSIIAGALARWTTTDLEQLIQTPPVVKEEEREAFPPHTRQWIVWHVLEHEIHHGGELSLALGMVGVQGFYTW